MESRSIWTTPASSSPIWGYGNTRSCDSDPANAPRAKLSDMRTLPCGGLCSVQGSRRGRRLPSLLTRAQVGMSELGAWRGGRRPAAGGLLPEVEVDLGRQRGGVRGYVVQG